jgi:hypothetical protein
METRVDISIDIELIKIILWQTFKEKQGPVRSHRWWHGDDITPEYYSISLHWERQLRLSHPWSRGWLVGLAA